MSWARSKLNDFIFSSSVISRVELLVNNCKKLNIKTLNKFKKRSKFIDAPTDIERDRRAKVNNFGANFSEIGPMVTEIWAFYVNLFITLYRSRHRPRHRYQWKERHLGTSEWSISPRKRIKVRAFCKNANDFGEKRLLRVDRARNATTWSWSILKNVSIFELELRFVNEKHRAFFGLKFDMWHESVGSLVPEIFRVEI